MCLKNHHHFIQTLEQFTNNMSSNNVQQQQQDSVSAQQLAEEQALYHHLHQFDQQQGHHQQPQGDVHLGPNNSDSGLGHDSVSSLQGDSANGKDAKRNGHGKSNFSGIFGHFLKWF